MSKIYFTLGPGTYEESGKDIAKRLGITKCKDVPVVGKNELRALKGFHFHSWTLDEGLEKGEFPLYKVLVEFDIPVADDKIKPRTGQDAKDGFKWYITSVAKDCCEYFFYRNDKGMLCGVILSYEKEPLSKLLRKMIDVKVELVTEVLEK